MNKRFEEKNKSGWIPFGVSVLAGIGVAYLVASGRGLTRPFLTWQNMLSLSDGFFVSAVMLLSPGLLVLISTTTDFFDIFSYAFHSLLVLFTPLRKPKDVKRYYEYKQDRKERRGAGKGFLLYAGGVCLAVSLLFLWMYHRLM